MLVVLADPNTNLAGFIDGAATVTDALAAVAPQLGGVIDGGEVTLAALNAAGPALGRTLEQLPSTETLATSTLRRLAPVVSSASATTAALEPDVRLLPSTTRQLAKALRLGTVALHQRTHGLIDPAIAAFDQLTRDPATSGTIRTLADTVAAAKPTLRVLYPEQVTCNTFGAFFRNTTSALSEGDASGTWLRFIPILGSRQTFQSPKPSSDLHLNYYPQRDGARVRGRQRDLLGRASASATSPATRAPRPRTRTRRARRRARAGAAGLLEHGLGGAP